MADQWKEMCDSLLAELEANRALIASIAEKIQVIEPGSGGGGNASLSDYESGVPYKRNNVVVDTETETCYRVLIDYTSDTVQNDCEASYVVLLTEPDNFDPTQYYKLVSGEYVHGSSGDSWSSTTWYKYTAKLKLLAAEGQVIPIKGGITQEGINNLPDDAVVTIYSATDPPYIPT